MFAVKRRATVGWNAVFFNSNQRHLRNTFVTTSIWRIQNWDKYNYSGCSIRLCVGQVFILFFGPFRDIWSSTRTHAAFEHPCVVDCAYGDEKPRIRSATAVHSFRRSLNRIKFFTSSALGHELPLIWVQIIIIFCAIGCSNVLQERREAVCICWSPARMTHSHWQPTASRTRFTDCEMALVCLATRAHILRREERMRKQEINSRGFANIHRAS